MLKENLFSDYLIFRDLRNKYPEHKKLIASIMYYAFLNHDTFSEKNYLEGTFEEDDVKLIFKLIFSELNLSYNVNSCIQTTLRSKPFTIVELYKA